MLEGFPPAGCAGAGYSPVTLVLGSFPSASSLALSRYYGHPRNHFWSLISASLGYRLPSEYEGRIRMLECSRIAIWDVIASCERQGSLDRNIREAIPNSIGQFISEHASIERIGLNGAMAASGFIRFILVDKPGADLTQVGRRFDVFILPCGELTASATPSRDCGRRIHVTRLPSSSPVPSAGFRNAEDKLDLWQSFILGGMEGG